MKFYVTFLEQTYTLVSGNPHSACVSLMKRWAKEGDITISLGDDLSTQFTFRVSEKGHLRHDDDEIIPLSDIINLLQRTNNPQDTFNFQIDTDDEIDIPDL